MFYANILIIINILKKEIHNSNEKFLEIKFILEDNAPIFKNTQQVFVIIIMNVNNFTEISSFRKKFLRLMLKKFFL